MVQYITTISKYLITLFMLFYTLECFLVFRFRDEKGRKWTYLRQIVLIILIQFTSFLDICLKTGDIKYLYFYAISQICILAIIEVLPVIYSRINRLIINNAGMLLSIGIIILTRLDFNKAIKQLVIVVISFAIAAIIPWLFLKLKRIPNYPYVYCILGMLLLMLVYTMGSLTNGSKLALSIFGLSFQASEFVKILFVLYLAGALSECTRIWQLLLVSLCSAIHVFLLVLSRDLGAALIFFVVFVLLVFISTRNYLYLVVGTGVGCFAAYLAYRIFRHVQVRVQAFIDPFSVIDNEGYQITQSLFALGSGNWFGLGLFEGTPETIPYVETDFIFSAIAEEMGVIFAICIIMVCLSCFLMFINIAVRFKDKFYKYVACGLGITYIFQVFLTVGGGTKFIPLTGVTLPFVSYGGSSVMATIITFIVIESMYILKGEQTVKENVEKSETSKKQNKHQTNIIFGIMYLFIACFLGLSIYLCLYISNKEEDLINNAYNPRQEVLISQNVRGTIYSRDLDVLAETVEEAGKERRYYPYANIFAHVVGYNINGKSGIEGQSNYYLINSNQPMSEKVSADIMGNKYLGDSVVTTLDAGLQKAAYTSIGAYNGAVVVSNPKTGEILAIVSKPDFNPNEIEEIWDGLLKDKESSVLLNRATQGLYPPGSCFKIITLLEYIKEHPDDYNKYRFNCVGELKAGAGKITCFEHNVHNNVDLRKSLAISCNSSFGNIGLLLDREKYQKTLDELLFNNELPLTMNYSESVCDVIDIGDDDLKMVRTAFGQGDTLMTPIHLNMITNAIANKGVLMKPYIVDYVMNCNNTLIKDFSSSEYKKIINEKDCEIVTDMMVEVCKTGTGKKLKNNVYTVAGKTGSAEYSDVSTSTHSWFTGFAPAEDPEISVTIILEDAGTSGLHAVPMAKKIFDEYFRRFDDSEYVDEK